MVNQASPDVIVPNIAQSYLQMPYNQYVWLRKEFMNLCGDADEAMILRVIEYEIEGDRRTWLRKATELVERGGEIPEEPIWWIALSHKQIVARLYDAIRNEKTIRAKLQSLIEKQFILMRHNPDIPYGSPQYTINKDLVQEKLNTLPPLPGIKEAAKSQASTPLPETVPPTRNGTPSQSRQEGGTKTGTNPLPKAAGGRYQKRQEGGTKTGTPYKKRENSEESLTTKERETLPANTSPPTLSLSLSPENISSSPEVPPPVAGDISSEPGNASGLPIAPQIPSVAAPNIIATVRVPDPEPPHSDAPPLNPPPQRVTANATLLARLTEQQQLFWVWWRALPGKADDSLTPTAYKHIVEWSEQIASPEDLQICYDIADARIQALCAANSQPYVPPRLGNLKNALGDWRATRSQKQRDREQVGQKFVPSYGNIRNTTYDRIERQRRGEVDEPLVYQRLPDASSRPRAKQGNISHEELMAALGQFRQRVVGEQYGQQ